MHNYRAGLKTFLQGGEFLEFVLENIYKAFLLPGDSAIDGGANRGRHTLPMGTCVGEHGQVIAFEALTDLALGFTAKNRWAPCDGDQQGACVPTRAG